MSWSRGFIKSFRSFLKNASNAQGLRCPAEAGFHFNVYEY